MNNKDVYWYNRYIRLYAITCLLFIFFQQPSSLLACCGNLVPNPSFESISSLPDDDCDWDLATGWTNAATSSECNTSNGTPDFYHVNGTGAFSNLNSNYFADVPAFSGDAAMGMVMYSNFRADFREYISIPLSCPLTIGETYSFSFALTLGEVNVGAFAVDNIGALFSVGAVTQPPGTTDPISAVPQISITTVVNTASWQEFNFTLVADQAYTHMTFGNFATDAQLTITSVNAPGSFAFAYYFVDDFSLTNDNELPVEVDLGPDQTICAGESITLTAPDFGSGTVYEWSTGAMTSSIDIVNTGTYSITVTTACGEDDDEVIVSELPQETQTIDDSFCAGDSYELNGETYTSGGTYTQLIVGGGSNGCDLEITLNLTERAFTVTIEAAQTVVRAGEPLSLVVVADFPSNALLDVSWAPAQALDCEDCLNPVATPTSSTTYLLTIIDDFGCVYTATISVSVLDDPRTRVFLPNAFSPNQDGTNDFFLPYFAKPEDIIAVERFEVFSRWGEQVFSVENVAADAQTLGWDGLFNGQPLNGGVFVYQLAFTDANGQLQLLKGEVVLVR